MVDDPCEVLHTETTSCSYYSSVSRTPSQIVNPQCRGFLSMEGQSHCIAMAN